MLPINQEHRTTIKTYLQEAIKFSNEKDLADIRLKNVFEAVKDSEDKLAFTLSEFKEALIVARDYEKAQGIIDKKTSAIEVVDTLKV